MVDGCFGLEESSLSAHFLFVSETQFEWCERIIHLITFCYPSTADLALCFYIILGYILVLPDMHQLCIYSVSYYEIGNSLGHS